MKPELAELHKRRLSLLNSIAIASDKIKRIDTRLNFLSHELDGLDPDNIEARP